DITQHVWLDFFTDAVHKQSFVSPAQLLAFLGAVAHHKLLDAYRCHLDSPARDRRREQRLGTVAETTDHGLVDPHARPAGPASTPNDTVAPVRGAGSGIGKATALARLREGYAVVLAGRRPEALQQTLAEAGPAAARALAVPADVSDHESVRTLFEKTKET